MSAFKTFRTSNRELGALQDNTRDALAFLNDCLLVEGVLIGPVTIGTTPTTVPHTLNRMPLGWFPVRLKGPYVPYEISINANNLTLQSSTAVTTHIWVF